MVMTGSLGTNAKSSVADRHNVWNGPRRWGPLSSLDVKMSGNALRPLSLARQYHA